MPYYAVRRGRCPGVYYSWPDCEDQVSGYPNNSYKKFGSKQLAWAFVRADDGHGAPPDVYTDGCCRGNHRHGNRRAGIGVYWGPGHHLNVSECLTGRPTNQRAEIQAAVVAVSQALENGIREINLHTDSMYLINCMTDWIKMWRKNGWISWEGEPVKNQDDLKELDSLMKRGVKVNWMYVPAHSWNEGNKQADRLANEGADYTSDSP